MGMIEGAKLGSEVLRLARTTNLKKKTSLQLLNLSEKVKGPGRERHQSTRAWPWMKIKRSKSLQTHLKEDGVVLGNSVIVTFVKCVLCIWSKSINSSTVLMLEAWSSDLRTNERPGHLPLVDAQYQ